MIKIHLSRLLGERRFTQLHVSRCAGIRAGTVGEIYNEIAQRINLEHLDRLCELLECDISDLLEYIPNKQPLTGGNLIVEEHGNRHGKKKNKT